jgi:hypothetical protein
MDVMKAGKMINEYCSHAISLGGEAPFELRDESNLRQNHLIDRDALPRLGDEEHHGGDKIYLLDL